MEFLLEFGLVILVATVLGLVLHKLKQPTILAYILTGIIVGPALFNFITYYDAVHTFSQLGVAFLLFIVGLSLSTAVFREVGKIALITGAGEILVTTLLGYFLSIFLGFTPIQAIYIAIALAFSSTIIVVKLLSDKQELDSLHGKIAVGFLIVQDFVAFGVLVAISGSASTAPIQFVIAQLAGSFVVLLGITYFFGKYVLLRVFEKFAKTGELLFLAGISWLFLLAFISEYMGFSIEIGALLAGISLAQLPYTAELRGKIKPLRDFFLVLFFVLLGTQIPFASLSLIWPIIILSLFVIIVNPIIVIILMGLSGYSKRTSFFTGMSIAQISEFSFIVAALGMRYGHIGSEIVALITIVGIVTIAVSSYFIVHADSLYSKFHKRLSVFERKKRHENEKHLTKKRYDIVVIGAHKMGHVILEKLKKTRLSSAVIDFDPVVIKKLIKKGEQCLYGDISNPETLDWIRKLHPKLIVSTVPNFDDNSVLIKFSKKLKPKPMVIVSVEQEDEALEMYKEGADFVVVPRMLGGEMATELIKDFSRRKFKHIAKHRRDHVKEIKDFLGVVKHKA